MVSHLKNRGGSRSLHGVRVEGKNHGPFYFILLICLFKGKHHQLMRDNRGFMGTKRSMWIETSNCVILSTVKQLPTILGEIANYSKVRFKFQV